MEKITKLNDKYLVIKKEDLDRYFSQYTHGIFTTEEEGKVIDRIPFNTVLEEIEKDREQNGKTPNNYVGLNLDDEIDLEHLVFTIQEKYHKLGIAGLYKIKVEKFAIDLVNAILKTKGK